MPSLFLCVYIVFLNLTFSSFCFFCSLFLSYFLHFLLPDIFLHLPSTLQQLFQLIFFWFLSPFRHKISFTLLLNFTMSLLTISSSGSTVLHSRMCGNTSNTFSYVGGRVSMCLHGVTLEAVKIATSSWQHPSTVWHRNSRSLPASQSQKISPLSNFFLGGSRQMHV